MRYDRRGTGKFRAGRAGFRKDGLEVKQFSLTAVLSGNARRKSRNPTRLIVGSFLAVIACGTLLLLLPVSNRGGHVPNVLDALFTATSATCVTGLVVFDTYTQFTVFGQVVILLLIQIGGLGLVTLTSFFHIAIGRRFGRRPGLASLRLASESVSLSDAGQARALVRFVIRVAFLFEAAGAVLLCFSFVPRFGPEGIFIAVFMSISLFCNAGFDILGRLGPGTSVMAYAQDPYVLGVLAFLIIAGGLGFLVWQDLASFPRTRRLRTHTKLVLAMTAGLFVIGTAGILLMEYTNPRTLGPMSFGGKLLNAAFQSVSARTAGCNSFALDGMSDFTKVFMSVLMFIGAAPGGTGGGVKVTTVSVVLLAVVGVVRGRDEAMLHHRRIDHKTVYKSLTILTLSLFAVAAASLTLFYNTGPEVNEVNSVFEAVSAFATVGLSVGVTALMNPVAKAVTIVTMFIGRVGPVSLALSLAGQRGSAAERRAVPPHANILVG